jgi:BMFP domain-containing protein YqiC
MAKKVIISESHFKRLLTEENKLSKDEVSKVMRDLLKTDRNVQKDIEKKVREIVAATVNTLFRTLWQRRNFYEDEIKKG